MRTNQKGDAVNDGIEFERIPLTQRRFKQNRTLGTKVRRFLIEEPMWQIMRLAERKQVAIDLGKLPESRFDFLELVWQIADLVYKYSMQKTPWIEITDEH